MLFSSTNIPYQEYRAINEIINAHSQEMRDSLRALIVFGEIVATGESQDIYLLEVVDHWQGPHYTSYGSTTALPLRGRLHLYFLMPDEFEHPNEATLELLTRIRQAYAILLEEPYDYAHQIMSRLEEIPRTTPASEDSNKGSSDPISFLKQQAATPVSA